MVIYHALLTDAFIQVTLEGVSRIGGAESCAHEVENESFDIFLCVDVGLLHKSVKRGGP